MPYRRVVEIVDDTGAWAPISFGLIIVPPLAGRHHQRGDHFDRVFLIFFGLQTFFFFLTTASQSAQRKRPSFGLAVDSPFLQFIRTEIISQPNPKLSAPPDLPEMARAILEIARRSSYTRPSAKGFVYADSRLVFRQR